jgi:3-oxoacyl-[acyl-carrier-protein] synthase-3
MPEAVIRAVSVHLPEQTLTNADLSAQFPEWSVDKIADKTGIDCRHIAPEGTFASDLAEAAGRQVLTDTGVDPSTVDGVVYCTQSPDYFLPTTACMLQHRLDLPRTAMAFDFNLGCSGYIYGLGIVRGLIASGQAKRVLLLTADTYTRYISDDDRSVRTLFGDGATASLIDAVDEPATGDGGVIGTAVYGTDGSGAGNLLVVGGGTKGTPMDARSPQAPPCPTLYMDGPEIFAFTLKAVPRSLKDLYAAADIEADAVDRFIFHQANRYMLGHLQRKLRIPEDRFLVDMADVGNTVSSTIPIVISRALADGRIAGGMRCALVGFGVGLSWGSCLVDWK